MGYFTQHLASWHRAARRCRAKLLLGTVGVLGWDSAAATDTSPWGHHVVALYGVALRPPKHPDNTRAAVQAFCRGLRWVSSDFYLARPALLLP